MSSVISQKKCKIVLFQGGLGDGGHAFDETIKLLVKTSLVFKKYPTRIDMTHYNSASGCFYGVVSGYYSKSTEAENEFQTLIANIVEFSKNNAGKTILVHTYLNHGFKSEHNLETIANQKIRLVRIIKELKRYGDIDVSLVGHSQGGLVNLEAAIEVPNMIKQLISISTPYAPVYLAEKLIFLDFFFKIGGARAYELFCKKSENIPAYEASVETLASSSYFNNLKDRWNNLTARPQLTVITGTAGLIYTDRSVPDIGSYTPNVMITKEPFDGLVKIKEQNSISHAKFIHLVNKNVPCYDSKKYSNSICSFRSNYSRTCEEHCTLRDISFSGTIIDVLFAQIGKAIKGQDIDDFANNPVVVAIYSGAYNRSEEVQIDNNYQKYYDLYADDFSHAWIVEAADTIGNLAALLI